MSLVAKRVRDKRVLKLLRAFLNAGVMEDGLVQPTDEGTPQGGPLSPWLSNVMLHELDKELEKRGHKFARFADDCNIYVASRRAGERVMASVTKFLEKRLKLKVNTEKSAVARPWQRKFLGFSFTSGKSAKRRIAPQAIDRMKERIRKLTSRGRGGSLKEIAEELASYLNGWLGYFGFCESRTILQDLDQWIRRRLKSLIWKRWKHGRKRYAELRKRDVGDRLAAQTAASCKGPWRISNSPALSYAFPNSFFEQLGIPTLSSPRKP
jgi:RNA-directed DNA polymerase